MSSVRVERLGPLDVAEMREVNRLFNEVFGDEGYQVVATLDRFADAIETLDREPVDLILCDVRLAGERSGNLDAVIRRYVAYEKVIGTVRKRTISALIYPAILVTMMIVLIGIIVLKVVPAFSDFYANFGRELPMSRTCVDGDAHCCRRSSR